MFRGRWGNEIVGAALHGDTAPEGVLDGRKRLCTNRWLRNDTLRCKVLRTIIARWSSAQVGSSLPMVCTDLIMFPLTGPFRDMVAARPCTRTARPSSFPWDLVTIWIVCVITKICQREGMGKTTVGAYLIGRLHDTGLVSL